MKIPITKIIRITGIFLLFSIFLQIILGAWVRLTGSGMSCPDWPLCYGFLFPTPAKIATIGSIDYTYFQVFLEWIHRANAAFIIGPVCIFFAIYILLQKNIDVIYKKYSYALLFVITVQGGLGGLTVFKSNIPWSVAVHLVFAFFLYLVVLLIILQTFNLRNNAFNVNRFLKVNTFITGLLTIFAAAAGAFTSKYGASLSCNSWPGCNNKFFPNFNDLFELIHFGHRLVAVMLVIALTTLFIKISTYFKFLSYTIKRILFLMIIIILSQVIIGALLIIFEVPIWLGIFHQATGLLLFTLISLLYLHMNFKKSNIT